MPYLVLSSGLSLPAVVALATDMDSMKKGQERIEGKVDAFSERFMAYLEREANR